VRRIRARLLLLLLPLAAAAQAPARLEATLAGHAILPAATFIAPPRSAPADARIAGKFAAADGLRRDTIGSEPAHGMPPDRRPTGLSLPFDGQPVQGISALAAAGDGSYWALADNGFGSRRNSPDALLALHRLRPDFERGTVRRIETIFLRDPQRKLRFRIAYEGHRERWLTGADLDPESLVADPAGFWIGDEFGPWLLRVDRSGVVQRLVDTEFEGAILRSPDHPLADPAAPARVQRSGGFESLAASADGNLLWALLEKPLLDPQGQPEGRFLRLLAFDPRRGAWTGESRRVPLAALATAVGDLATVAGDRAWMIERDGGEGDPRRACPVSAPDCFATPARHRRLVLFDLGAPDADGLQRRLAEVDLLDLADPRALARQRGDSGLPAGRFGLPFATIESIVVLGDGRLLVANDNNLPFSAGRFLRRADDTEFVVLQVARMGSP
jgi:hypothetical protein